MLCSVLLHFTAFLFTMMHFAVILSIEKSVMRYEYMTFTSPSPSLIYYEYLHFYLYCNHYGKYTNYLSPHLAPPFSCPSFLIHLFNSLISPSSPP